MILDTNALSALVDGDRQIEPVLAAADAVVLTPVVLGEFRFGIAQSRRRIGYERWFDEHLSRYALLPIDEETSISYAEIRLELKRAGTPIPVNDLWIAALARQHRLPVLSRDRHFDLVPKLRRLSW